MSTRRVPALLLVLVLVLLTAPSAGAQDEDGVTLTLERQRPWATTGDPTILLEVRATNRGPEQLEDLSLRATVFAPVLSRTIYEQSLLSDQGSIVASEAKPFDGSLASGQARSLPMSFDMTSPGISTVQSYVYPVKVELLTGSVPVATLRTATVQIVEKPEFPLAFAWRVVLHHPLLTGPGGPFRDGSLERAVAPEGSIGAAAAALREGASARRPLAVDVVVSPVLLLQLQAMADGYSVASRDGVRRVGAGEDGATDARRVLEDLRALARAEDTAVSSWTFAGATLPSLLDGLSRDFDVQMERGRATIERVLGVRPPTTVVHPRGSAIDADVLQRLETAGTEVLLLDPEAAPPPPQELGFAPPPLARLPVTTEGPPSDGGQNGAGEVGETPFAAVVPDAGVQELLASESATADSLLGAQQAFAEMATIWLEAPGQADPPRGLALAVPDLASPGLVPAIVHCLKGAPFLRPMTSMELRERLPLPEEPASIVEVDDRAFSAAYAASIKQTNRRTGAYGSLTEPSPTTLDESLETALLLAEGKEFLDDEAAGAELIAAVNRRLDQEFAKVRATRGPPITLTSLNGTLPIQVVNDTGAPVRVLLEFASQHVEVVGGPARAITLREPEQTFEFDVHLQTTGEFPVTVLLRAPSGRRLSETTIAVRSTEYNRIALVITIGAALALLGLWARRFLPSRRTT